MMQTPPLTRPGIALPSAATIALVAGTAVVAGALAFRPGPVLLSVLALCMVWCGLLFVRALPSVFLLVLGIVLIGYALFGRSFAYLGAPPVYVGEMTLALGIVAALASGSVFTLMRSPTIWLILALSGWGAAQTFPYVQAYGADALRDAALWGYGAFAIVVAACILNSRLLSPLLRHYSHWVLRFVAWMPLAIVIGRFFGTNIPNMPGTDLPILSGKSGDAAVHLAGAAAFMLVGLQSGPSSKIEERPRQATAFWALWLFSFMMVAAINRGGFLAIASALIVVGTLDPAVVGKRLATWGLAAVVLAGVILLFAGEVDRAEMARTDERALSPGQVVENVLSITGRESGARGNLSATRAWRLDWWNTIIDYTVHGHYFWTGKGFGINLADDDGFQVVGGETPLRSPHNAYMTMLARAGVPGVLLWVGVQACFGISMLLAYLRARMAGAWWWARVDLWILSYWCACLVNAAFDVFLEGPQGGIWFWSIVGLGIAVLELQRQSLSPDGLIEIAP